MDGLSGPGAQPAAGGDGRDGRAAGSAQVLHQPLQHVPRRDVRGPARGSASCSLRLPPPRPRKEEIYFIGACNVPIDALDPALTRPGRMGRHIWFRTPTKDDRKDIFDLYMAKVDHEPDLDTDHAARRAGADHQRLLAVDDRAVLLDGADDRPLRGSPVFAWRDIVEAMTTVEAGTAQNIDYVPEETRAVAIHEAGHAAAGHVYLGEELLSTRLSIRKRGGSLGHYQSMEKDERFSHFRSSRDGQPDHDARRDGRRARLLRRELPGRQRRPATAPRPRRRRWSGCWGMGPDAVTIDDPSRAPSEARRTARARTAMVRRAGWSGSATGS